ncbi:MAG: TrbI/VirB10 family protein [Rhodomicrobium sp.]
MNAPSPDLLGGPPARGQGVRRLNRVPLMIAMAILALIMATVAYTYHARLKQAQRAGSEDKRPSAAATLLTGPEAGYIEPKAPDSVPVLRMAAAEIPKPIAPLPEPEKLGPYHEAWENYLRRLEQIRRAKEQVAFAAAEAPSTVQVNLSKRVNAASPGGAGAQTQAPSSATGEFMRYASQRLTQLTEGAGREADLNRQAEKREFIAETGPKASEQNTLSTRREAAATPYELRAGAIIPAVMTGGVNSDLPGQLLAQVSQNVYDTATGSLILIPQGSKLLGTYSSAITTGQERVLVAWTRIVFPDASALDLGRMPGADESGYAGLTDQVNDHFRKVWSNALLLSAFSAGIQLSQGYGGNNQTGGLNATQTIAASTGQQMGQLGQEIARRNLQIQPTLEVRPGYRFVVQVTKDIILKPWVPADKARTFVSGYPYREGVQR